MDSELQQRLRKLTSKFAVSLPIVHVLRLATHMWSAGEIHETEFDAIKSCTESYDAATKLLEFTRKRGDKSILGLAKALRDIEKSDLADQLHPEAACQKLSMDASDSSAKVLSERCISVLPEEDLMTAHHMTILELSGKPFTELSNRLSKTTNVCKLYLDKCILREVPEGILSLKKLEILKLSYNPELNSLHSSIGQLSSLKELDIGYCGLQSLPKSLWDLKNLEKLILAGNAVLESISSSISQLSKLQELDVGDCPRLVLPESLWDLKALTVLRLTGNPALLELSSSITKLQSLRKLDVGDSENLRLPDTFWDLCKLEELCLSENKELHTFPPEVEKLQSLKVVYASCCGLTNLPEELGKLVNLEQLHLADNEGLKSLFSTIGTLQSLKILNVSNCGLSNLPISLGNLYKLQSLNLACNKDLQCLYSELGRLCSLEKLDISSCGLTKNLEFLKNLRNLKYLNLSNNYLEDYPECTLQLDNLKTLDVSNSPKSKSGNRIKRLPRELASSSLEELLLDGNPVASPPKAIWKQGLYAIKSYMKQIHQDEVMICVDTINIIGDVEAGKTSVAQSLAEGIPHAAEENDRTQVVKRLKAKRDSQYFVHINDFGGHALYHSVIPMFLNSNGLIIIAYNLLDTRNQRQSVEKWLLTTIAKSSDICVVVVGTRSDLKSDEEILLLEAQMSEFTNEIRQKLIHDIDHHISALECLNDAIYTGKLKSLHVLSSKIEKADLTVTAVSCVKNDNSVDELRKFVFSKLRPLERIPLCWYEAMKEILDETCDYPYLSMEQVKRKYKSHVLNDPECTQLVVILRYLVASSQVLWFEDDAYLRKYVFHSPQMIVDICKDVLDHDNFRVLSKNQASSSDVEAYKKGILRERLLRSLLRPRKNLEVPVIIDFLKYFHLISEIKPNESDRSTGRQFVIPSNLPQIDQKELKHYKSSSCQYTSKVTVILTFYGSIVPLSFFETNMSIMLSAANELDEVGVLTDFWRDGLTVEYSGNYLEAKRQRNMITISAESSYQDVSPWSILCPLLSPLYKNISASWPGAPPQCAVLCPACQWINEHVDSSVKVFEFSIPLERMFVFVHTRGTNGTRRPGNRPLTCTTCDKRVPRSLCFPMSTDSFTSDEEREIMNFYQDLRRQK